MAQFLGLVKGSRKSVTRLGSKNSGLTVQAFGWDTGVTVEAKHKDGTDYFEVYYTGGSNDPKGELICVLGE